MQPEATIRRGMLLAASIVAFASCFGILGILAGHVITYRLVDLSHHATGEHAAAHGYLAHASGLSAIGAFLAWCLLVACLSRVTDGLGLLSRRSRTSTLIAVTLPPLGFLAQEFVERAGSGEAPPLALLAVGAVVQSLVGLAVLVAARFAIRVAVELVEASRATRTRRDATGHVASTGIRERVALGNLLAANLAGRAPPALDPLV